MLNKFNFIFFIFLCINFANSQINPNEVYVKGYTRNDGTVVAPYYRTAPNSTNTDNFSTLPNINPYTLEPGHIIPDSKENNINTQINNPNYSTYYPSLNNQKSNYSSYELQRILDELSNQQYQNNVQKPYYQNTDEQKANYSSYELKRILEKIYNQRYYNNVQNHYYSNTNEQKANYSSYELERILEKIYNQQYYNNIQKPSYETIDQYDTYNNQNIVKDINYISEVDSSASPVDSSLIINISSYEKPKIIITNNKVIENTKNDLISKNSKNEFDISVFAKICVLIFAFLIIKKILA